MSTKTTLAQMWEARGNFLNTTTGEVVEQPDGWFPIVCGPWPNANIGARQARCSKCEGFVGISPAGWAKKIEKPDERPIFCTGCFEILRALIEEMNRRPFLGA